ncbi:MAG: DUF1007 family protein, partial [Thiovulaceae bacterium]|nr:DUF1007 family protein [Sulfurimonadaceae bacterium]
LILFSYKLFACATCALMVPTAEVTINLNIENKTLKNIDFLWTFSDIYTKEITTQYDKNKNNKLDADELDTILQIKNNYLTKKDMLTNIKLTSADENITTIQTKFKNMELSVENENLIYKFTTADMSFSLQDKSKLSIVFEDNEDFFSFIVTNLKVSSDNLYYQENLYLFTANIVFSYTPFVKTITTQKDKNSTEEKPLLLKEQNIDPQAKKIQKKELTQENILKDSINKIKSLFEQIKDEKNPLTYIALLLFAYMYGVVHALGPGHGKTLVASYFLTNERSYTKALFISLAIGIVHTFSAFLLTVAIYFFLDVLFAQFVDNAVFYTTKISALIIIFIALYLLMQKYKVYKELQNPIYSFSTTEHPKSCGCGSCKVDKNSTDAALIISAGLIPCPGTITIFIFSLSLGLYYAGFLSALVMSLGMSTIIFFSAILSVYLRKKTSNANMGLKKFLDYGSLFIILILGFILLFT